MNTGNPWKDYQYSHIVADKFILNLRLSFVVSDNLLDSDIICMEFQILFEVWTKLWKKTILILLRVVMRFELPTTLNLWRVIKYSFSPKPLNQYLTCNVKYLNLFPFMSVKWHL